MATIWNRTLKEIDNDTYMKHPINKRILLDRIRNEEVNPNLRISGLPFLCVALQNNDLGLARELIKLGADVNAYATRLSPYRGMAPIHFARSAEAIELLAQARANVDAPYTSNAHSAAMRGETLLHTVTLSHNYDNALELAEALLRAGASPFLPYGKEYKYNHQDSNFGGEKIVRSGKMVREQLELMQAKRAQVESANLITNARINEPVSTMAEARYDGGSSSALPAPVNDAPISPERNGIIAGDHAMAGADINAETDDSEDDSASFDNEQNLAPPAATPGQDKVATEPTMDEPSGDEPDGSRRPETGGSKADGTESDKQGATASMPRPSVDMSRPGFISRTANQNDDVSVPSTSDLLNSMTYRAQKDGSVLYLISDKAAFVDHGSQLLMAPKADTEEKAIVAAILIAKEKFGGAFELTGDPAFKRRAIEVMLKYKIDVKLKSPEQDAIRREVLAAMQAKANKPTPALGPISPIDLNGRIRPASKEDAPLSGAAMEAAIPLHTYTTPDGPMGAAIPLQTYGTPDTSSTAQEASPPTVAAEPINRLAGTILSYGEAPFDHVADNKDSYFVELKNADGRTKMVWGVDLERAIDKAKAGVGDQVLLQNLGRKLVEVDQVIRDKVTQKVIGTERIVTHRNKWEVDVTQRSAMNNMPAPEKIDLQAHEGAPAPIRAIDWWLSQREAIRQTSKSDADMQKELRLLGPKPAASQIIWFDIDGRQCDEAHANPNERYVVDSGGEKKPQLFVKATEAIDAADRFGLNEMKIITMNGDSSTVKRVEGNWIRDNGTYLAPPMPSTNTQSDSAAYPAPKIVVQASKSAADDKEAVTMSLFKGNGNYLHGTVTIGDKKRHVIANLGGEAGAAVPDRDFPKYLPLLSRSDTPAGPIWKEIGYGNAINKGNDDKPIYFDEMVFRVGKQVVKAAVAETITPDLHRELGFVRDMVKRRESNMRPTDNKVIDSEPTKLSSRKKNASNDMAVPKARRARHAVAKA